MGEQESLVPDITGFEEYLFAPNHAEVLTDLLARGTVPPGRLVLMPYPNLPPKMRAMAVVGALDLVALRAAAGRILTTTEPRMSPRVYSCRLAKAPPAWAFRNYKRAHRRLRSDAIARIKHEDAVMCRTDVMSYFPSVSLPVLVAVLLGWGCDPEAVEYIERVIEHWQVYSNLRGLPIGPEASSVLGNALLIPMDEDLASWGLQHERWMDDVLAFGSGPRVTRLAVRVMDGQLADLRLCRSDEKTHYYDTSAEALEALEDPLLVSAFANLRFKPGRGIAQVYELFDAACDPDNPNPTYFRAALTALSKRRDDHAVNRLAVDRMAANVDPRATGDYLRALGTRRSDVVEGMMVELEQFPTDLYAALSLHHLRALSRSEWGETEGSIFVDLATDVRRYPPVRAWAWRAAVGTPAYKQSEVMESSLDEEDPLVRRAMVATLRTSIGEQTCSRFLRHVESTDAEMRHTARWAAAA